jgi:hypothetical protein
MLEEMNLSAVTIKLNLNKDLNINEIHTKTVLKITITSKKLEKKKSAYLAAFWLEEFDLLVKTIAFEKWFFQYNRETNDKICNLKKHIFYDNFQNYGYLLFNTNTVIHYKFVSSNMNILLLVL